MTTKYFKYGISYIKRRRIWKSQIDADKSILASLAVSATRDTTQRRRISCVYIVFRFLMSKFSYGKQNVPVFKIRKRGPKHSVFDMEVQVMLEGNVSKSWLSGDNSQIVPTETQKNTCYALALKTNFDTIEDFGLALGRDLLARHHHLNTVRLELSERMWDPIQVQTGRSNTTSAHNHAFMSTPDPFRKICKLDINRDKSIKVTSGVRGVKLMKTTQSGFKGFVKDEYTNLKPVGSGSESPDRILCTELEAQWTFTQNQAPEGHFRTINDAIWQTMLDEWGGPPEKGIFSPSLQATAYKMATAVLRKVTAVSEVFLFTPNVHFYTYPLEQFGMSNKNEVFQSTDCRTTASGVISTRVGRNAINAKL